MRPLSIVIAGGGITGLTTAYYTLNQLKKKGIDARITLVEQSDKLGGKIHTWRHDGFVIERGADSFLARKLAMLDLAFDLQIDHELTGTNPAGKRSFIWRKGRMHPIPGGFVLGIPTQLKPFMTTKLLSPLGKARAALDLLIPRKSNGDDESLGGFFRRRLGDEVHDHIAEPLLSGIYAGDTNKLSVKATFPQFLQLEQDKRSVIMGMLQSRKTESASLQSYPLPSAARNSVFLTFKNGLSTLIEALIEQLNEVDIRTGVSVEEMIPSHEEDTPFRVKLSDGELLDADAIVLTIPTYAAANLLEPHHNVVQSAKLLREIEYVSVANVVLAFNNEDGRFRWNGSGFVVPRGEALRISACTWTSNKWLHTAPQGKVLLRCYVGREGEEDWMNMSDEEIVAAVRRDLKETMGITEEPLFTEVTRLIRSMPQYPVGHLTRLDHIRTELNTQMPGLFLAGAGYEGVGMPDCIKNGKATAASLVEFLQNKSIHESSN